MTTLTQDQCDALIKRAKTFEADVGDRESAVFHTLTTKKHEFFNAWAKTLEELYLNGVYSAEVGFAGPVNTISAFIRRKLIALGCEQLVPYAKDVLPAKYKQHDENPNAEIRAGKGSLNKDVDFAIQNADAIKFHTEIIRYHEEFITWLKNHPFLVLVDPDEWEIMTTEARGNMKFAVETRDDRWRVPAAFHAIVNHLIEKVNINFATAEYGAKAEKAYNQLKLKTTKARQTLKDVSSKQFHKIGVGEIKELAAFLKPRNRVEAGEDGYLQLQCPELHWRLKSRFNTDAHEFQYYCYDCADWIAQDDVARERPAVIVKREQGSVMMDYDDSEEGFTIRDRQGVAIK